MDCKYVDKQEKSNDVELWHTDTSSHAHTILAALAQDRRYEPRRSLPVYFWQMERNSIWTNLDQTFNAAALFFCHKNSPWILTLARTISRNRWVHKSWTWKNAFWQHKTLYQGKRKQQTSWLPSVIALNKNYHSFADKLDHITFNNQNQMSDSTA